MWKVTHGLTLALQPYKCLHASSHAWHPCDIDMGRWPYGMLSLLSLTRGPHAQAHDASAAWDLGSMAATLTDWGLSLQDGVTVIADNISDFVADLASAFDAGWEGEEEQRPGAAG